MADFAARVAGCLLGGAVGDALGNATEFMGWSEIERAYGPDGIQTIKPPGHFTDDTQMTLFTAEGLLRGGDAVASVRRSYLTWLHTQGVPWLSARAELTEAEPEGWLVRDKRMHRLEAPGNTCLGGLRAGGNGTATATLNHSRGCGGVMRMAPVALLAASVDDAYQLGCDLAVLTHGDPDGGWHPAGCLAAIVASLVRGASLADAVDDAIARTSSHMAEVLRGAVAVSDDGMPSPQRIARDLGAGWHGDEALGIAVACALAAADLRAGVIAAANHSGDTDSAASICGNILGAFHGIDAVPVDWLDTLDARDIVERMADEIVAAGPR